jgi:hypothetical protein
MIEITWYANAYATRGEAASYPSFEALCRDLADRANVEHDTTDKRHLPAFMPGRLTSPDATRGLASVAEHTVLVLDVDKVEPAALESLGRGVATPLFWYASPSDPNPDGSRRVRILAPTPRPITLDECRLFRRAFAWLLGLGPDCGVLATASPAQLFFVGRLQDSPDREWHLSNPENWRDFQPTTGRG